MKFYKTLLKFIQIAVILVVLPRVASFVQKLSPPNSNIDVHDVISIAFALTLGLGTIATAYFANDALPPEYDDEPPNPRERKRREREAVYFATMLNAAPAARKAMVLFAVLDGAFNLADAVSGAFENGLFDAGNYGIWLVRMYAIATVFFGIAPTILAMMLAYVISLVDRIPMDYERPISRKEIDWVRTIMGNFGMREFKAGDAAQLLASRNGDEPETVRHNGRSPDRTPNAEQGRPQTDRIMEFLRANSTADNIPGVREIRELMEEPKPSLSTISQVRNAWINNYDPWRNNNN